MVIYAGGGLIERVCIQAIENLGLMHKVNCDVVLYRVNNVTTGKCTISQKPTAIVALGNDAQEKALITLMHEIGEAVLSSHMDAIGYAYEQLRRLSGMTHTHLDYARMNHVAIADLMYQINYNIEKAELFHSCNNGALTIAGEYYDICSVMVPTDYISTIDDKRITYQMVKNNTKMPAKISRRL